MPYIIDGIINVLLYLMFTAGPTPVAGMNGTTAAFLQTHSGAAPASFRGR